MLAPNNIYNTLFIFLNISVAATCRPALPSRLQLTELQQLLGACEALSHLAESAGARPVLTLRNAIQVGGCPCIFAFLLRLIFAWSQKQGHLQDGNTVLVFPQAQCKSYLDAMHSHSLTQLTGSFLGSYPPVQVSLSP